MASFKPWQVIQVDLHDLPDLPATDEHGGLYLVFWWHGLPLGQLELTASQLPLSRAQLLEQALGTITPAVGDHLFASGFKANLPTLRKYRRPDRPPEAEALFTLERPLARLTALQQEAGAASLDAQAVSVIICTRDRPEQLKGCLAALQALNHKPCEIIVVDNAPTTDATRRLIEATPGVTYLLEPRPGLSIARNTGIQASTGSIIAFTDDDVRVHPDWLRHHLHAFADPKVMATTGLILTAELETEAQLMFHKGHAGAGWGYRALTFDGAYFASMKRRGVPVWQVGAGANMAFRRELFDRVGLFDERLGAGASGCSEDSEMWYRVLAEGWHCRYEPTAVVFHHHRAELSALEHQMHQYMRGHVTALLVQFERYRHWGNLRRAFGILPLFYSKLLLRSLLGGKKPGTLRAQILGCAAGFGYYLRYGRQQPRPAVLKQSHSVTPALRKEHADA
jgi:GT2 family glycosyltransferase